MVRLAWATAAYERPDPLIYDQYFLMDLGLVVTYDKPEIELRLGGTAVLSSKIPPATVSHLKFGIAGAKFPEGPLWL